MNFAMKHLLLSLVAVCLLCGSAHAQGVFAPPVSDGWQRTSSTQRQSEFPKVNAASEYWFRFHAPATAKDVKLEFAFEEFPAHQDAEGWWNVVAKAPKVGYQIVRWIVDGVRVPDPGLEFTFSNGWVSTIEIPSPQDEYYLMRDVPHGDVREHWFFSKIEGKWRRAYVYTPPGYDLEPDRRYPVLYLQHGAGENETEWTHTGFAAIIADNLIAEGRLEPLLIVMNNDFVYRPGDNRGRLALADKWNENYEEMFLTESLPDIEAAYRIIPDAAHRAMAGLSLGGMLTGTVGVRHSDMFGWLGIFSGGVVSDPALLRKDTVKLVFETCGSQEYPERIEQNVAQLRELGFNAATYVSPDTAHEWQTWRRSLYQFLPLLFK